MDTVVSTIFTDLYNEKSTNEHPIRAIHEPPHEDTSLIHVSNGMKVERFMVLLIPEMSVISHILRNTVYPPRLDPELK